MYEELVKSLQSCPDAEYGCSGCKYKKSLGCREKLMAEAADAIEELSGLIGRYGGETGIKVLQEYANKYWDLLKNAPRWIPVTERLPKTRESILGKKSSKVIVAFRFDDGTQGTDTAHTLNGEWVFEDHITVVARTITHWMPLPQPPGEE